MGGGGQQYASSGRGGAGNFTDKTKSPKIQPQDLQTPTLKTPIVTTGRGGSGNMAPNVDPIQTRARQDVEPVARRESQGAQHSGRGGAGNVFKGEDAEQAKNAAAVGDSALDEKDKIEVIKSTKEEPRGLAAKGKALLGLGKKD